MGKLGKKARKFAKKNLQSVLKRKRKINSVFKKRFAKKGGRGGGEDVEDEEVELSQGSGIEVEDTATLDTVFSEEDSDEAGDDDDSDSDGYLSEDDAVRSMHVGMHVDQNEKERSVEGDSDLLVESKEMQLELAKKMKRLKTLKEKDPEFSKFLERNDKYRKAFRDEQNRSHEDEASDDDRVSVNEDVTKSDVGKLSTPAVDSLCQLVMEHHNVPALLRLVNGYRAACHYGTESSTILEDSATFSKILMFMLREADNIFRKILGISCSHVKKEGILELQKNLKWKTLKPLVNSYLRSTLFLLYEVTDPPILAFALTRLRASIVFFGAFPTLLKRLVKVAVRLWATSEQNLSLSQESFLIIKNVASTFNSGFDTCLIKAYKAFIGHCKFVEPTFFNHLQFLRNTFVELCSQDLQKSFSIAMVSIQQLAKILQLGLRTKKKEPVKKLCSWQYANCIDLWVEFISVNIHDYDLQPLLYMIIQIVNGVAVLFPGPRYLPLRVKCVQWLNRLSSSSGVFIPVASLVVDIMEYKIGRDGSKPGKDITLTSSLKLPKHLLKSRDFQEECVISAIELLVVHFAMWSHHISFPELATIPLICLRKFHGNTKIESSHRMVKRIIDQVEQNIEFVQKKRDEVAYSPNDQQSTESFLQLERSSNNAPFTQYYRSIMEKASSRNFLMNKKISSLEQMKSKRKNQQLPKPTVGTDKC